MAMHPPFVSECPALKQQKRADCNYHRFFHFYSSVIKDVNALLPSGEIHLPRTVHQIFCRMRMSFQLP
jgi:hypothetical protein